VSSNKKTIDLGTISRQESDEIIAVFLSSVHFVGGDGPVPEIEDMYWPDDDDEDVRDYFDEAFDDD
jgi:hypothetical protein